MKAEEFLNQIFVLNKKIKAAQNEVDVLRTLLTNMSKELQPDPVQISKSQDPLGDSVVKIIELECEINKMIDEYVDNIKVFTKVIDKIQNPKEVELLNLRYIQGESWTDIARQWKNSNTWVHEIKKSAFDSVQKILDEIAI